MDFFQPENIKSLLFQKAERLTRLAEKYGNGEGVLTDDEDTLIREIITDHAGKVFEEALFFYGRKKSGDVKLSLGTLYDLLNPQE